MKTVSAAMTAHLARDLTKLAYCWLVLRADDAIFAFTNHDVDIVFNFESWVSGIGYTPGPGIAGTGSQTYLAASGYTPTDVDTSAALNVDNSEVHGILVSPSITEDDLRAGLWDFAAIALFLVNWEDTSMGAVVLRIGHVGEVTAKRGQFSAEQRGLTQAYSRTIGQLASPSCRADYGDTRCGVDLVGGSPSLTVFGNITSISADGLTLYDTARTEPGPTGGIAITGITNANPGVVTLASAVPFAVGSPVTLSGIVGPTSLNTVVQVRNPSGSTFELSVDTSDTAAYPPYVSGGTATPLGDDAGYFDSGKITILDGANAGFFREVKSYVPGQMTIWLPFPYDLELGSPGTSYKIHRGCPKSFTSCRDRDNNAVNFRGEPYLPGVDKLVQVGRHK